MLKVRHSNYYQRKLQNNYFQPKVLLLAQPLLMMQVLGLAKGLRAEVRATHVGKLPMNPRTFNISNYPQLGAA